MPRARPTRAFIPPRYYAALLDVLSERGHDAAALAAEAGIEPERLEREGFFTLAEVERLVGRAASLENVDAIGLEVGKRLQLMSHGSLGVAALTAPTAREALELVVECFPLVSPLFSLELASRGEVTAVRLEVVWELDPSVERFHTAAMSGSLHAQVGLLLRGELPPGFELDARHPRPPGLPAWVDEIGVPIRFDRPAYELRVPTALLRVGLPLADRRAYLAAREACFEMLESRPDPHRLQAAVERELRAAGPPFLGLDETARALGLSGRSLRRRLEGEGTSFRACLESVRLELAERYLLESDRSITAIGLELGYTDPANFSRAFRRARGVSPSALRRENAGERIRGGALAARPRYDPA